MTGTSHSKALFWRKFNRLTRGHVPLLKALRVIETEETDPHSKEVLTKIREQLGNGLTLSEAMVAHPEDFSPCILELLKSAEKSGAWDDVIPEIIEGLAEGTFE